MGGGWSDSACDSRGVGVAEIDEDSEHDDRDEETEVGEKLGGEISLRGVDAEGEHDDDAAGTDGNREGKGVKGLLAEVVDFGLRFGWSCCRLRLLGIRGGSFSR